MSIWNLKAGKSNIQFRVTTKSRKELLVALRKGREQVPSRKKPQHKRPFRRLD